jgi:hypothetical protein
MNPRLTEELHSSMEQFTEQVVVPSGLARSAYVRWRKRRVMNRAAAAAAAAVVAVAAIGGAAADSRTTVHGKAVGGKAVGGKAVGANAHAQDAAYVVTRVEKALTAVGRGNNIFFSRSVTTGSGAGYTLAWNTRDRFNEMEYTSSGRLWFSLTVTRVRDGLRELVVQYLHQMVGHQLVTGAGTLRGCSSAADMLQTIGLDPNDLTNWPATVRVLVGCKLITAAGHQRDGLISFTAPQPGFPGSMTLLVNASTFLPSRMMVTYTGPGQQSQTTTVFGSLPPTRANLAHLSAPVPAGFAQVYLAPEAAGNSADGNQDAWLFGQ